MQDPQSPTQPNPNTETTLGEIELLVVHQTTVLHPSKGWRTTVRIQDGWQGATLSHWSRGGADIVTGTQKALSDCETSMEEALNFLPAF